MHCTVKIFSPILYCNSMIATYFVLIGQVASAQEIDVAAYAQLSIERLQLVEDRLRSANRSPTDAELQVLWRRYDISEEEYLSFRSRNPRAVNAYLTQNPEAKTRIGELAARIRALANQQDGGSRGVPKK